MKLAVLGSTRGTDLQAIIDAIENKTLNTEICIVISNKQDAFILERAKNHNIPSLFIDQKNKTREQFDQEVLNTLEQYKPDLILLIGYMRILSPLFVHAYKDTILNVHPSLLPAFAGGMDMNVHQAVIESGVKETGCTIHLVDEGVDTGKILVQKKCLVDPNDTAETLKEKVQKLEGEAFVEAIQQFSSV